MYLHDNVTVENREPFESTDEYGTAPATLPGYSIQRRGPRLV